MQQKLVFSLQNPSRSRLVPTRRTLRRWAIEALRHPARITVRVVGTAEGKKLNAYRGRDYATNVLSFCYGKVDRFLEGDLVICAPVVAQEARAQKKSVTAHFAHLVVHGLLHIQGMDHETEAEAERMERREKRILKRLGYADPYASAGR